MYNTGIDTFVEIGPGKTLSGFVKRMKFEKEIKILNINNCESLEKTIEELKFKFLQMMKGEQEKWNKIYQKHLQKFMKY